MRNILNLLLCITILACADHREDYGRGEELALKVEGILPEYEAVCLDSLKIPVTIGDGQMTNCGYEWRINHEVVSTEKDLNIILNTDYGKIPACFIVENLDTGMKYYYDFTINTISPFTKGIFLLSDNGENGMLSFLSNVTPNSTFKTNVFQTINESKIGSDPRFIGFDKVNGQKNYIVIVASGDKKIRLLGENTLKEESMIGGNDFYTPIPAFIPTYYHVGTKTYSALIEEGKPHFISTEGATKIPGATQGEYYADNWIGQRSSSTAYFFAFDKLSNRFFKISGGSLLDGFSKITFLEPTFTNCKLVAGSKDYTQTLRALMLDTITQQATVYKFNASSIVQTGRIMPGILDKNSVAQLGAISVYWYLAQGNRLFRMDVNGLEDVEQVVELEELKKGTKANNLYPIVTG